jgi:hypothetical protein
MGGVCTRPAPVTPPARARHGYDDLSPFETGAHRARPGVLLRRPYPSHRILRTRD